jgi:hypothetical protein
MCTEYGMSVFGIMIDAECIGSERVTVGPECESNASRQSFRVATLRMRCRLHFTIPIADSHGS